MRLTQVKGFPTIAWVSGPTGDVTVYEGDRSLPDLTTFVTLKVHSHPYSTTHAPKVAGDNICMEHAILARIQCGNLLGGALRATYSRGVSESSMPTTVYMFPRFCNRVLSSTEEPVSTFSIISQQRQVCTDRVLGRICYT